jgi:predicted O-methyltransferase YrrM
VIPQVSKECIPMQPIEWLGLHREYLQAGEMEIIAGLLRSVCAGSIIEFGCRDGRTAKVLLHNVQSLQRYVGIDVPMRYQPTLSHQRKEMVDCPGHLAAADPRFSVVIHERGSLDVKVGDFERFDAAFIDGDHSEFVVDHDSRLALALVRVGGIIIWHDAFNGAVEVMRVLERLRGNRWPIQHVLGTWIAYMRHEFGSPP